MDWEKVKNLTIIFLIILNLTLSAYILTMRSSYALSEKTIKEITSVLEINQIALEASLPQKFSPKRNILATAAEPDLDKLEKTLFHNAKKTVEINKITYSDENSSMTFEGGKLMFETRTPQMFSDAVMTTDDARREAAEVMDAFDSDFSASELSSVKEKDSIFTVTYNDIYKKSKIMDSYAEIVFSKYSITVEIQKLAVQKEHGEKQKLLSPDEALLIVIPSISPNSVISSVELVYKASLTNSVGFELSMCYRIEQSLGEVYFVDALIGKLF